MKKVTEIMVGHESFGKDKRILVRLQRETTSENSHEILEMLPILQKTWGLETPLKFYMYENIEVKSVDKVSPNWLIVLKGVWWKFLNKVKKNESKINQ